MTEEIRFPLIEITDWIFEGEKGFTEILEEERHRIHHIKERDIPNHYKRRIVDSNGFIIKISNHRILEKNTFPFSIFGPPTIKVLFDLENTGFQIPIDNLKKIILSKAKDLYPINKLKLMSESEFIQRIEHSSNYEEIIKTATFMDE
jgi:hypothetical protein